MTLVKYKEKRNFDNTPEPEGKVKRGKHDLIFVVQRHHASHLHYDFRLELDGTLKSWAIPKGPSLNPADRRLAMQVEDHPISYATFEGDIPTGNYGAGHVDVWDHGTYTPEDEHQQPITAAQFAKNLEAGSIKFTIKGRHLKGSFALVKFKGEDKSWLLIKHKDQYATQEPYNSEDYAKKSSLEYTRKRAAKKAAVPKAIATKKVAKKAIKKS
ncbi:MAG: DNA polymerase ligase N-terminal domain-containing protein [Flavipsychrobacter sp.]|nr:DNA polymerase ligase N-terminal domain-containing protein [Flavipsychrobacter sp.]